MWWSIELQIDHKEYASCLGIVRVPRLRVFGSYCSWNHTSRKKRASSPLSELSIWTDLDLDLGGFILVVTREEHMILKDDVL